MGNVRELELGSVEILTQDVVDIHHGGEARASRMLARRAYEPGELIFVIEDYTVMEKPCWQSLQISETRHITNPTLRFMNHSCDPSAILDTDTLECWARRPIAAGDQLTFFYPSTEWSMDEPFDCLCGADACLGVISGARHLPAAVRNRYDLNAHILRLMAADGSPDGRE